MKIHRRFVSIGNRHIHYLRCGKGSPVVLLHAAPLNSSIFRPQMEKLADKFTCIAFDLPGFGRSDSLPPEEMTISGAADALAEAMMMMQMPKCPILGNHTGSCVALELALRHPEFVSGIILDGLPLLTKEEQEYLVAAGYFAGLERDELGGYLQAAWTRIRDMGTWFPWSDRKSSNYMPMEASPPARIHSAVFNYLLCGVGAELLHRAAVFYTDEALAAVSTIIPPAALIYTENDENFEQVRRLPPLKPEQECFLLGDSQAEKDLLIEQLLQRFDGKGPAPADGHTSAQSSAVQKQFVDLPWGQILVRSAGDPADPAVLILHDAPGSAALLANEIVALAHHCMVYAIDLPGCGESDALPGHSPTMSDYVEAIERVCRALAVPRFSLYGIGFGASIAIEMSQQHARVLSLIVTGALLPSEEERREMQRRYAPPIDVKANGSHWYDVWTMLREGQIWRPWYKHERATRRPVDGDFSVEYLHIATVEVMKQLHSYHHIIQAALNHDVESILPRIAAPVWILTNPKHPFSIFDVRLKALCPQAQTFSPDQSLEDDIKRIAGIICAS